MISEGEALAIFYLIFGSTPIYVWPILYFLPTFIKIGSGIASKEPIFKEFSFSFDDEQSLWATFVINLCVAWTGIGWVFLVVGHIVMARQDYKERKQNAHH